MIYGANTTPMEEVFRRTEEFPANSLLRMVFTPSATARLRDSLFSHGITEAALFPELEGLARDLRRTFGFQI